jgi:eukaryotic-like serine/threonine-protein kinase
MPPQLLSEECAASVETTPQQIAEEHLEAELPRSIGATRRIDLGAREGLGELRTSHPKVAIRLEEALAEMPAVGSEFLGFHLVLELGRGAFGRVFLAKQSGLADRLVALKVSADLNGESQRLAQLQHTNIMPIYSEHRSGKLYAVCMPYFGSTTLADLCKALRDSSSMPTTGRHLVSTLFNRQTTRGNAEPSQISNRSVLPSGLHAEIAAPPAAPAAALAPALLGSIEKMSYVEAVLWIAGRLAEGLAHAHERGIIHRDLKPANVLLGDDGQPLLLDFNLSEDVKVRSAVAVAQVGGTLPYMSPEQLLAYREGTGTVDARADIYALGLIIYHLLTGRHAFTIRRGQSRIILPLMIADRKGAPPMLRASNRAISPAVESIVRHCLEADPGKRYASARELAEDIERHRINLPLKHAQEPSLIERAVKWSRRHPRLASPSVISAMIAAVLLLAVAASVQLSLNAKKRELTQRREAAVQRFHEFDKDYRLAQDLLTSDDPAQLLRGMKQGEQALRDYGVLDRADWFEQPAVKELTEADRAALKAAIGEVAFLLARVAHFQPKKGDTEKATHLHNVAEANLENDARAALSQQKADLADVATDTPEYARMRAVLEQAAGLNIRGRFLLACEHAARGRNREALTVLDRVVCEDPNDFGSWFLKARCHQLLEQDTEAIAAYGTAIALRPNYSRSYIARAALCYMRRKNLDQAKTDLDQALLLEPGSLEAHIDRGLVLFRLGKNTESLDDLDWALEHTDVPSRVWFVRARVRAANGDLAGSQKDKEIGLRTEPTDSLSWVARGFAKIEDDPAAALADFVQAEEAHPRCLDAMFNQAYVYCEKLKKPVEAIAALDRLLKQFPDNFQAMGFKAVVLARLGKMEEAVAIARQSLRVSHQPETCYRASCVLALASTKNPALQSESLRLLSSALARGWGHKALETDGDLDSLRGTMEFKTIAAFSRLMRTQNDNSNEQ